MRLTEAMGEIERKLGPVFLLVLGGQTMVVTTRTEDAKTMYANEGKHPARPVFPVLSLLRQKLFGTGGLVSELGYAVFNINHSNTPKLNARFVQKKILTVCIL